jgi:hypothetical protein
MNYKSMQALAPHFVLIGVRKKKAKITLDNAFAIYCKFSNDMEGTPATFSIHAFVYISCVMFT